MGAFELEPFAGGTRRVAEAIAAAPGDHRGRRRRLRGRARAVRARRRGRPPLDRRRRVAGAGRGQDRCRAWRCCREPHAVHRRQLEDEQDDRRGGGVHRGAAAAGVRRPRAWTSRSARRSSRCRRWSTRRAARASASTRRPCTRPTPAPSPARSRRRCSPRSTSTAWCSGTPSAASTSTRPTGRCSRRCPKALEAGLVPILCVGETEEERERGDTERKLRHQVQEGLDKVPIERLPEVVVAYEPVWAIGTGLTRDGRAGAGRGARSCARWSRASTRPPARRCGSSTAAR